MGNHFVRLIARGKIPPQWEVAMSRILTITIRSCAGRVRGHLQQIGHAKSCLHTTAGNRPLRSQMDRQGIYDLFRVASVPIGCRTQLCPDHRFDEDGCV